MEIAVDREAVAVADEQPGRGARIAVAAQLEEGAVLAGNLDLRMRLRNRNTHRQRIIRRGPGS